jgi:arylsulfatase A-like enzyme
MSEAIDTIVGRVLDAVDLETTYVFVMGDNGSPGEAVVPPFMFNQAKGSVYEGGVRVPLIIAGPGVARGEECAELVHVTDLFATIRELSGLGPPTQGAEDSVSFAEQLTDPLRPGQRETLFVHKFPFPGLPGADVRAHRADSQQSELYDLLTDPFELDDLLVSQPGPATANLRDRLLALMPTFP